MRAVGIERFGDTPELREMPEPEPGGGQVRIAVEAAATNPLDLAVASGALAELGTYRFPLTLGMDGAGTVIAVGDGVTGFRVGERVFGQFWGSPYQFGTFADVCVVQAAPALGALAVVPDELPGRVAAALPTAGMTALGVLDHARVPAGGTLLVIGATGGVGTFAVQAAAARGIRVLATATGRSGDTADRLRDLGADAVVTGGAQPLDQALRDLAPGGVDAVLDAVGDRALTGGVAASVREGGALLSTAFGLDDRLLADRRIRAAHYRLDRKPERLAELAELAASGALRPVIGAEVPLQDTPRALTGDVPIAGGLRGKTVIRVS
ncbi:putative alcohol dehydrogenase [Actinacidiphila reveromycinica]|uniref:Putative alcohol dehydrogenase n=1 Tax=Actinacidiphila reveromycinica TaxID=659352 RepID=A0A7U3UZK5_9ACTN|nr:NADP-dependent oxidoreductase [Streptomyces sp. SN-593]BBB01648.1 putative alcohol dehydrogenase [Streptomyces sp. SN-593]